MFKANISNIPTSEHINDGLKLNDAFITAALKCVPPEDKPNKDELHNCFNFFEQEINLLKEYPRGTMLIQNYNPTDQGHIAIVIESNRQGLLLSKIIHNVGAKKRQYNKTVIELFKDYFYCARFTHVCLPKNWIFRL